MLLFVLCLITISYSLTKVTPPIHDIFTARGGGRVDIDSYGKPEEIRRAVSGLSYPSNLRISKNFFPSLLQDEAASCYWKENRGRLVPETAMNDLGVPLLAHICTNEAQCKNQCLEMHEDSDIEVCNYITWYENSNTALFYSLEPAKHWTLKSMSNVKSFEWRCVPNDCSWYWKPQQIINKIENCSRCSLLTTTFCRDFGHCQRQCETIPSCNHFYMPNNGTEGYGRLYRVPEDYMEEKYYVHSDRWDSFEMRCKDEGNRHPEMVDLLKPVTNWRHYAENRTTRMGSIVS